MTAHITEVPPPHRDRLKVREILFYLIEFHLKGKASQRPFRSNAKALCISLGDIFWDALTEPEIAGHVEDRKSGKCTGNAVGNQSIKHDLVLLSMAWIVTKRWKRRKWVVGGYDFAPLQIPLENPVIDISRPKTKPRKKPLELDLFVRWTDSAPTRLRRISIFLLDTGMNPIELARLRTADYTHARNGFYVQRGKSGAVGFLPASDRCRDITLLAIQEGREFILDFTNWQHDYERHRKKTGINFQLGRDLRCRYYNEILRRTNRDYKAAQRAMLHADPRTGPDHYEVDEGVDLRGPISELAAASSVGKPVR